MKMRLLVLLIVLALAAVSGVGLATAQSSTMWKAVTLNATNVYTDAAADAEIVETLALGSIVDVLDVTGDFFMVDGGYIMMSDVAVLNLPALAPKAVVSTAEGAGTSLFASNSLSSDFLGVVPDGTVASLLAVDGQLALVQTTDGVLGWSLTSAWDVAPEGFGPALVTLGSADQAGVFSEANVFADVVATVPAGETVYIYGEAEGQLTPVMTMDGTMGYMQNLNLDPVPQVLVEAEGAGNAEPAVFSEADFGGDVIATLDAGTLVYYMGAADDFWAELYHPTFGVGYGIADNFSAPYTVGTVFEANSLIRAGASTDATMIGQLQPGDKVVILGVDSTGEWFKVAAPYEAYFEYLGGESWMNIVLFQDFDLNLDFDPSVLPVAE